MVDVSHLIRGTLRSRKMKPRGYADGGDVDANDMIEQARAKLASQRERFPTSYGTPDEDAAAMSPETYVNPLAKGLMQGVGDTIAGPGRYMTKNPYAPGTEEADWFEDQRAKLGESWGRDTALNTMGTGAIMGVPVKGAEAVLGAGLTRKTRQAAEAAYKGSKEIADEAVQAAAKDKATGDVAEGVAGSPGGAEGVREAQLQAERRAASRKPLPGLPTEEQIVDGELFTPGPVARAHEVADRYMADKDFGTAAPEKYHEIDKVHAKAIAKAYDEMKHAPDDPAVRASYEALVRETLAQYQAIKASGIKITPVGAEDYPYHGNPRAVVKDVADNNHMAFFKTSEGFGVGEKADPNHPMLRSSGETIGDHDLLNNDLFRIVHDYFGHVKNGNGFRATGEDNAFRAHSAMYSDLARPAMTTETRGQNSWLNYGPHGDFNRTANALDTIYAPQKVGLMPEWTMKDRIAAPAVRGRGLTNEHGLAIPSKDYSKASREALDEIAAGPKGAGPVDLSTMNQIPDVPQVAMDRYVPPRGVSPRMQEALENPDVKRGIARSIKEGVNLGADKWYHSEPLRRAFVDELGPERGQKAFTTYMDMVSATSPRSEVPPNIRNASYYYAHAINGAPLPEKLAYPYGHVAQNLHRSNFETLTRPRAGNLSAGAPETGTAWDIYKNPKPASFSQNLQGNLEPGTMDTHAFRNISMRSGDPRFLETSISDLLKPGQNVGPDTMAGKYGEIAGNKLVYRPQKLLESGKLTMEEAQKIPSFWATKPNENEYAAAEQLYRKLGKKVGLPTADAQAAAWAGAGKMTGLGTSPTHTFPELFNERVLYTAKMRGEDPKQTLKDFIRGKKPLLSIAGAAAAGSLAAGMASQGDQHFADGGGVGDDYNTPVPDEAAFQNWKAQNAPNDSGADYDLRGAYLADMQRSENGHMGDRFKKPNHPTFSDQSQYAIGDQRDRAGFWVGPEGPDQTFVPPAYAEGGDVDDGAMMPETYVNPLVKKTLGDLATLPRRAIENSQNSLDTGNYDPSAPVETALTMTGGAGIVPAEANSLRAGMKAYHSSPHDFDKFDLSKVGSGQGAQVYGHGLYFAENPAVGGAGGQYWHEFKRKFPDEVQNAAEALARNKFDREATIAESQKNIDELKHHLATRPSEPEWDYSAEIAHAYTTKLLEQREREHAMLTSGKPFGPRTYEVGINADPEKMLHWDKTLDKQQNVWDKLPGNVRDSIDEAMEARGHNSMSDALEAYTGRHLYTALKHEDVHETLPPVIGNSDWYKGNTTDARHTSEFLNSLDVPGIKYLDQGSRPGPGGMTSAGMKLHVPPPTHNYVMFNDKLIDILKKYGIAGAAAPGMAEEIMGQHQQHFASGGRVGYAAGGAPSTGADDPDFAAWKAQNAPAQKAATAGKTGDPEYDAWKKSQPMSASDVVSGAISNAPASAMQFGSDLVRPFMHPIETATGLKDLGLGLLEKAGRGQPTGGVGALDSFGGPPPQAFDQTQAPGPHEKNVDAMVGYLADRYGGIENIKRSFAKDPVGVLSDASMILTGGGTAAERLPGIMGKTGEIVSKVGRATDPLMAPVNAARAGTKVVGEMLTHTGAPALENAYKAGVEGGEAGEVFRDNMRGNVPVSDVVDTARQGVSEIARDRQKSYVKDMADLGKDQTVLSWDGVTKALQNNDKVKNFRGVNISPSTTAIRSEIQDAVFKWGELEPAIYHTPVGFDALKQMVGDIRDSTPYGTPQRKVANDAYNAIRAEIVKQAPDYAKTMKNYETASSLIKEMEQTLSLGQGKSVDTSLRKLQSIMRNNVNTNYGRRLDLGHLLEENGATHLMAALSGQSLNAWFPRGLGKLEGAGTALAAFSHPVAAAALPLMSPRLMGETSHFAGRTVGRLLNRTNRAFGNVGLGNRAAGNLSYRAGRATNPFENDAPNPYAAP